jgi:hypothetical protein
MPTLRYDGIGPSEGENSSVQAYQERGITELLRGWLRRALRRGCAAGLWTLSPDGKLQCESLGPEAECECS